MLEIVFKFYIKLRFVVGRVLNLLTVIDHISAGNKSLVLKSQVSHFRASKIAIYVAFNDFHDDLWERNLFEGIRLCGFELITVSNVSESDHLFEGMFQMTRENKGYDLAACRDVLRALGYLPSELLLINSSTAWDSNARLLIEKAQSISQKNQTAIVYATQSFQPSEHGQSFFIYARGEGVFVLRDIYEKVKNWRTKRATVHFGEIRMFKKLRKTNVAVGYLFEYRQLSEHFRPNVPMKSLSERKYDLGLPLNPSQEYWKVLISLDSHFVKRNLVNKRHGRDINFPDTISEALTIN
jgi:hypothetical protein